jgi:hypothetical protein
MTGRKISLTITTGFVSGIILGIFLYIIELLTDKKVYTLLMNVDFIPILSNYTLPAWIEFSLHLVISLILSVGIQFSIIRMDIHHIMTVTCIVVLPTIFLYFPLSMLATKEVPNVNDTVAFCYWSIGHIVYAVTLGYMLRKTNKAAR